MSHPLFLFDVEIKDLMELSTSPSISTLLLSQYVRGCHNNARNPSCSM